MIKRAVLYNLLFVVLFSVIFNSGVVKAEICPVPADGQLVDTSKPTTIVGNGSPTSCTSAALDSAVQKGGIITFNCGPNPVTITLSQQIRINNVAGADKLGDTVIDGGGKVTLDGSTAARIFYLNACEQPWNSDHCQNFDHPRLTVQNMTFVNGKVSDPAKGGGAIYAQGGLLKVVNCSFFNNHCAAIGQDVAGGAVFSVLQSKTVYLVNSSFGGSGSLGNSCSNGGAIGSIGTSYSIINSVITGNSATGTGANPGNGGNGGGVSNDGNTYTLTLCGTTLSNNAANAIGGGIFFVSNDGTGKTVIEKSSILGNLVTTGAGSPKQAGGLYLQGTKASITDSTIANNSAPYAGAVNEYSNNSAGTLDLVNVTISGNSSTAVKTVLEIADDISGTFLNSTIAGNTGGIGSGAGLKLTNSIVANNGTTNCSKSHPNGGGNIQYPSGGTACTANVPYGDPKLGPLQDNGGSAHTWTMAVASGSSAINAGHACPPADQRGVSRPAEGCTSGAYEFASVTAPTRLRIIDEFP
jgi:hypothetical protein